MKNKIILILKCIKKIFHNPAKRKSEAALIRELEREEFDFDVEKIK